MEVTLPKIKDIIVRNIYDEDIKCKMLPLSLYATKMVEEAIENLKNILQDKRDSKVKNSITMIESEGRSDEELFDAYLDARITLELSKLGEEVTEKRVENQKEKRKEKLLDGKTRKDIINELAGIIVDTGDRKDILFETVTNTLYHTLRNPENLKENIFKSPEEVMNNLDQDSLFNIFSKNDESKVTDDDLKNS